MALLNDINGQDINGLITSIADLDEAAAVFAREVGYYLSKYAKVKDSPVKKTSKPFLKEET